MNVQNVGDLSLGQWGSICRQWNKAHGDGKAPPPSEDEFDLAVMRVRGAA
ncbi:MAG: hypothetical protein H0W39_01000 [Sphingomonas sp.]|nr:hypothetical protein [Sphingomonas sp.]